MIRILHLTDFHLNRKTLKDWDDFLKDAFFKKIEELQNEKPIDLVLFTGDMLDKAGFDFKEINDSIQPTTKALNKFKKHIVEPILEKLNIY